MERDYTTNEEDLLDGFQVSKTDKADGTFVIIVNGCIGYSTGKEIECANSYKENDVKIMV